MALPNDFTWRAWTGDDLALAFEGRNIALICPLDNGRYRVGVNCNSDRMRYQFFDTEGASVRYVEAWATKWADDIRNLHHGRSALFR